MGIENIYHCYRYHNMQQAARVSDKTAYFYLGEMIEYDDTKVIFTNPKRIDPKRITGRFG